MRNDGSGTNHRVVADFHTLQYNCASSNPNVVTDPNGPAQQRLGRARRFASVAMIMVCYIAKWTYHAVLPDFNSVRSIEHRESVNVRSKADANFSVATSLAAAQQYNPIIQGHAVAKVEVPRVSRYTDPTYPTMMSDACAHSAQSRNAYAHRDRSWIAQKPVGDVVV